MVVKVSLIWLNYNSSGFIDVTLRSIESVLSLDFDEYEVMIVGNASTDGNFEVIRKFVEERRPSGVRVKFVHSDMNRGYVAENWIFGHMCICIRGLMSWPR